MLRRFAVILIFAAGSLFAEEGMWLLTQIEDLPLKEKGLEINVEDIYSTDNPSIKDAIVMLNFGSCSASLVSSQGLVLTNHHCAFGALQRSSSAAGVDYITDGFLAQSHNDEIPVIGGSASVLQSVEDITEKINVAVEGIDDVQEREKAIDEEIRKIKKEISGDRDDIYVRISSMYNGAVYHQYVYKTYHDVRIVYAPPRSIGNYGDEIDNWMWPRHTGDFTFLRVYQGPDGSGAKYSEENVPLQPKRWLKVASGDLKEGDFTFIMGNPGRTSRYRTSYSVDYSLKYFYPGRVQQYRALIDLIDEITADSPEGRIKLASYKAGLENSMKNYQGNIDGMTKTNFVDEKRAAEADLIAFLKNDDELYEKYGDVFDGIAAEYTQMEQTLLQDDALIQFGYRSGTLTSIALTLYDLGRELEKPVEERDDEYDEKALQKISDRLKYSFLRYYEPVDKALLLRVLNLTAALDKKDLTPGIEAALALAGNNPQNYVDEVYEKSRLKDQEFVLSLVGKTAAELKELNEPLFELAETIYADREAYTERNKAQDARLDDLRRRYIEALFAWKGDNLYPDANSTMRFTYGHVAGYKPADAVTYAPFTRLKGVLEKNSGIVPFDMPEKLAELYENRDFGQWVDPELGDVPVNFLHRCDITGGNSGSAVMNARGELIGLAFDGNYEAMTSDWQYNYDMQRTISVDIRYVLFITEKFAGADYLIDEMDVAPPMQGSH